MRLKNYILKNKKISKKTLQTILIVSGSIFLLNLKMIIAGSLLLVLGYFSVLKND